MLALALFLLLLAIPAAVFGWSAATSIAIVARVVAVLLVIGAAASAWSARRLDHGRFDID